MDLVRSGGGPHVTARLIVLWCAPAASSPAPAAHRCAAAGLDPDVATKRSRMDAVDAAVCRVRTWVIPIAAAAGPP